MNIEKWVKPSTFIVNDEMWTPRNMNTEVIKPEHFQFIVKLGRVRSSSQVMKIWSQWIYGSVTDYPGPFANKKHVSFDDVLVPLIL